MVAFRPGQLVRLAPEWLDNPKEAESLYRVVEDNGDRCIVELVCDLPIPPQELVRKAMIIPVEE